MNYYISEYIHSEYVMTMTKYDLFFSKYIMIHRNQQQLAIMDIHVLFGKMS